MVAVQRTHRLSWLFGPRLPRAPRQESALAEVAAQAEGALVAVRGTIECAAPLRGVLVDVDGVYRRMVFGAGGRWVHEAAVDFALVDARGGRLLVQASGARWVVADREPVEYPIERLDRDGVSPEVRERVRATGRLTIAASELVLEPGTAVQIIGFKTTSPDAGGELHGYRLPPQRATLRSGPKRPLVITRASDLA